MMILAMKHSNLVMENLQPLVQKKFGSKDYLMWVN